MDTLTPGPSQLPLDEAIERAVAEIEVAIELVIAGAATRVTLTALPGLPEAAGIGAARAQAAEVGFRLVPGQPATVVVGPRRPVIAPDPGNDRT